MAIYHRITASCLGLLLAADCIPAFPVQAEGLPASCDLRTRGLASSVKDQISYETSWAFSALNSIETQEIATDPRIDLSEWHLAYYTYFNNFGYPYSTDNLFNASTYDAQQETGILTSWIGPVSENKAEMCGDESITNSMLSMDEVRAQAEYHVTDALNFGYDVPEDREALGDAAFAAQRNALKTRICDGQVIDVSFKYKASCFAPETNAYCYTDTAEEGDAPEVFWHSVSIVGYDDAFPAANFTADPGMDGAWLCKDSFGTGYGDHGYFWLSYADPSMDDIYVIFAESAKVHNRLCQHDAFGNSGKFAADLENGDASVMAANVFTADADGYLTSVMFCNVEYDTDVEFTVYTGLTDPGNPVSGTVSGSQNVFMTELGYQTIDLEAPVALKKGEQFAVVAKISGETAASRIPCEFATHTGITHPDGSNDAYDSIFSMEMLGRDFAQGQSFYSTDGTYWYDLFNAEPIQTASAVDTGISSPSEDAADADVQDTGVEITATTMRIGNICMKAVTRDSGTVTLSDYHENLLPGEKITLTNDDQAPIYYSLDGTSWSLYEEPIAFPEGEAEMEISAYADLEVVGKGNDKTLYTQKYTVKKSAVSSILCIEADSSDYALFDEADPDVLHYSVPAGTESIEILPISAGTLTIGGKTYTSGQTISVPLTDSRASAAMSTLMVR